MKKLVQFTLWASLVGLIMIVAIVLGCNYCVVQYAKHRSFSEVDSVRFTGVGLLLGNMLEKSEYAVTLKSNDIIQVCLPISTVAL